MSKRGRQTLSDDDRHLWTAVSRNVIPLSRRSSATQDVSDCASRSGQNASVSGEYRTESQERLSTGYIRKAVSSGLCAFEAKELKKLKRGTLAIESRIDLHGLREQEAYLALMSFVRSSYLAGFKRILVITGQGHRAGYPTCGVIRRNVPHWLTKPEMRDIVLGFEQAGLRHGGAGAMYIRLRTKRA